MTSNHLRQHQQPQAAFFTREANACRRLYKRLVIRRRRNLSKIKSCFVFAKQLSALMPFGQTSKSLAVLWSNLYNVKYPLLCTYVLSTHVQMSLPLSAKKTAKSPGEHAIKLETANQASWFLSLFDLFLSPYTLSVNGVANRYLPQAQWKLPVYVPPHLSTDNTCSLHFVLFVWFSV
jgi:hypothetical protein